MDFVRKYAADPEYIASHERYRGLVLFHRTQAAAALALERRKPEEAIDAVREGMERLIEHQQARRDRDRRHPQRRPDRAASRRSNARSARTSRSRRPSASNSTRPSPTRITSWPPGSATRSRPRPVADPNGRPLPSDRLADRAHRLEGISLRPGRREGNRDLSFRNGCSRRFQENQAKMQETTISRRMYRSFTGSGRPSTIVDGISRQAKTCQT